MSQATNFGAPLQGPKSPATVTAQIDDSLQALLTNHLGTVRPEYLDRFGVWVDQINTNKVAIKMFDGANDKELYSVDFANGEKDLGDLRLRVVVFDKLKPTDLSRDGEVAFDSSRGLIIFRSHEIGQASGNGAYTILDTSNVKGGTGIDISATEENIGDTRPIEFNFDIGWGDAQYARLATGNTLKERLILEKDLYCYSGPRYHTNQNVFPIQVDHKNPAVNNLTANRSHNAIDAENIIKAPANANMTDGKRLHVRGGAFRSYAAEGSQGDFFVVYGSESSAIKRNRGHVGHMRGAYNYAGTERGKSSGSVQQLAGTYTYVNIDGDDAITDAYGHRIHFNPDSGSGSITNAYGLQIWMDRDAQTITNKSALHINYDGDWGPGERYGIYATETTKNYLHGDLEVTGDVSALSDISSKDNIVTICNGLDLVTKMRGVIYDKDGKRGTGVIAQELQSVLPEVVSKGENELLRVAYGNMAGVFIEAFKDVAGELNDLRQELKELRGV